MCRPSRLILEGQSYGVTICEPGLRWTRQRRAQEVEGRAGSPCEPAAMCGRAALMRTAKPCGPGRRCYGQAFSGDVREPNRADGIVNSRGEGGQRELGSRESTA